MCLNAVLIAVTKRPNGLRIDALSDDYLNVTESVYLWDENIESPAILKKDGIYFMFGSHLTGWNPNDNVCLHFIPCIHLMLTSHRSTATLSLSLARGPLGLSLPTTGRIRTLRRHPTYCRWETRPFIWVIGGFQPTS